MMHHSTSDSDIRRGHNNPLKSQIGSRQGHGLVSVKTVKYTVPSLSLFVEADHREDKPRRHA